MLERLGFTRRAEVPSTAVVAAPTPPLAPIDMDVAAQQTAVDLFCPEFRLHPEEKYYPANPSFYLERCALYEDSQDGSGDGNIIKGAPITSDFLYQYAKQRNLLTTSSQASAKPASTPYFLKLEDRFADCARFGQKYDLPTVPVYAKIAVADQNKLIITYRAFFCRQGPYDVLGIKQVQDHDADMQYLVVQVNRISQQIEHVFYGHHGTQGGSWKNTAQIKLQHGTHPVVYVSQYRHGFYANTGVYIQQFGIENDHTAEGGIVWQPKVQLLLADDVDEKNFDTGSMGWNMSSIRWNPSKREDCTLQMVPDYYRIMSNADMRFHWQVRLPQRVYSVGLVSVEIGLLSLFLFVWNEFFHGRGLKGSDYANLVLSYLFLYIANWTIMTLYACN